MKVFFNKRKSKLLLLTLLTLAVGASPARAQETLTICDGSATNSYVPIYGYYADTNGGKSEFIIPKDIIEDLADGTITSMKFFLSSSPSNAWTATWEVFLREVDDANYTSAAFLDKADNSTTVYTGTLDATSGTMSVSFTNNFVYSGDKNLLIGIYMTANGSNYPSANFLGEEHSYACTYKYGSYGSVNRGNFLPKIEFTYNAPAGTISKPKELSANNVTYEAATLSWVAGSDETEWEVAYNTTGETPAVEGSYTLVTTNPSTTLSGLAPETTYYAFVRAKKDSGYSKWTTGVSFTTTERYPVPAGLETSNVTTTSATLTWTAGAATSWEVAVNTTGETPTEAGTVVSTATYDFTELTTETTYYAFVRVKDGDNYSKWSAPCEFIPSANTYLTVNEGTTTNYYVPINGSFSASANLGGQFIIPAANLTDVQNKVIKKLTFYSPSADYTFGEAEFDVCVKEVESVTMTSSMYAWDETWTTVYSGTLAIVGGKMNIPFTSDYNYNGNNLLIGIHKTSTDKAASTWTQFYGSSAGYQVYRSNYSPNGSRSNFQPKTTIGYQEKTGSELKVFDGETELTTSPASFDFGLAEAGATHTFTLKNTAATPYVATISSENLTVDPTSVTPTAEGATFSVTMPAQDITDEAVVITPAAESSLEPFTINVSGTLRDPNKVYVNGFTALPEGWSTDGTWYYSAANGAYTTAWYINQGTLTRLKTPKLDIATGEKFIVEAKGYSTSNTSYQHLQMQYSADGQTWTNFGSEPTLDPTSWKQFTFTGVPAGQYYIGILASQADIRMFYGGAEAIVPVMTTTATDHDFGVLFDVSDEWSFTISNEGKAELTGLSLSLAKTGNAAEYSIRMTDSEGADFTGTTLAVGATVTVYVKQLFSESYGAKSDVLTIAAEGQNTVTVNLTGTTRNPDMLVVDFENNFFPVGWQKGDDWAIGTASGNHYAVQGATSLANATALVTTPLTVAEGETLTFKVCRNQSGSSSYKTSLQVRYSQDGGVNWSDYTTYYNNDDSNFGSSFTTKTVSDVPAGKVILEFYGCNIKLDDIEGFLKTTGAALTLKEEGVAVANGDTKDFGNLSADGGVTYTLINIGNAEMKSTITTQGDITVSPNEFNVQPGQAINIEVTMAYREPYGAKTGTMTITTQEKVDEEMNESWVGNMTVNFKGEAVDPNSFVQDFEQNSKPAGWYSESWTYADGVAHINAGLAKPMITEKVAAEEGKNRLSFNAKIQAGGDQTLSVYTSTDRQTWSEAQTFTLTSEMQTFTLSEMANGEYYVKFEALNAQVDNLKGLKKVALPEHDLFVTATELPTDQHFVENEVTATATVTSLITDETGVYAKLFVNDSEVVTSDATNIALNATATLTMSYTPTEIGTYTAYVVVYDGSNKVLFTSESSTFEVKDYPALTLDETATEAPSFETGTYNVTVNHRFVAGWNTICLPFAVEVSAIAEGAEAYSFDDFNAETNELTFNSVRTLDAATPYVIYVPQAIEKLEFKKQALNTIYATAGSSIHDGVTFQGTYTAVGSSELSGCYGLTASGKIMKASATATMSGLRGYFKGVPAGARATFVADGTQGIRTISIDTTAPEGTYDLQGRRVEQLKRGGLYIINGKKAMVK